MIAQGQKFENQMISLDGGTFRDCEFVNCVVFFSGLLPVDLRGTEFKQCRWEFAGPAGNTMGFLRALYQRGEKELVNAVLDSVRSDTAHEHEHDHADEHDHDDDEHDHSHTHGHGHSHGHSR